MVAIVAGNGLGLFNSSLNTIGEQGVNGNANQAALGVGTDASRLYVNGSTGNLIIQTLDEQVSGMGIDAQFLRTYNSRGLFEDSNGDSNGDNWRHSGERNLVISGSLNTTGSSITRIGTDGNQTVYDFDDLTTTYRSTDGGGAHDIIRLTTRDEAQVLQWREGSSHLSEFYDQTSGRLLAQVDSSDNAIEYAYDALDRLSTITDAASGQTIRLAYNENGLLASVRSTDALNETVSRQVHYTYYDISDLLKTVSVDLTPTDGSVDDGVSILTEYTYHENNNLVATIQRFEDGGEAIDVASIMYDEDDLVSQITDLSGTTTFDIRRDRAIVTNAEGEIQYYDYDDEGRLILMSTSGEDHKRFFYNDNGDVTEVITAVYFGTSYSRSTNVSYFYDANGNRVIDVNEEGNYVTRVFSSDNLLLSETTYTGVGYEPDPQRYVSDPLPVLPSSLGDAMTTTYVYSEQRELRFVVSPEGRVTEYQYNDYGLRTHTIQHSDAFDFNVPTFVSDPLQNQSANVDESFAFTVPASTFVDVSGGDLTLTARQGDGSALPSWLSFDAATGTFSGTPTSDGVYSILVTASGGSAPVTDVFRLSVGDENQNPVATTADYIIENGIPFVLSTADILRNVSDVDSPSVFLISVEEEYGGPVSFDSVAGTVTFSPWAGYVGSGGYRYMVSDGEGGSVEGRIDVYIQAAVIRGTEGNDTLNDAGYGYDDVIYGLGGDDTINSVGGQDRIFAGAGNDTVNLSGGYNSGISRTIDLGDGNDVLRSDLNNTGSSVYIDAGSGNDDIELSAGLGGDVDLGAGDDVAGVRLLNAGWASEARKQYINWTGGLGNDTFTSSAGSDTFFFGRGDGHDSITDIGHGYGRPDRVRFAPEIAVSDVTVAFDGANLVLTIHDPANPGVTDSITIVNAYSNSDYQIEEVVFADGSGIVLTASDLIVMANSSNTAPVANNDAVTTVETTPLVLTFAQLLANDTDAEGDTLSLEVLDESVVNGTLVTDTAAQTVTFTANNDFLGAASFDYRVADGNGGYATASVNIDVQEPVNIAPIAQSETFTIQAPEVLEIRISELLSNDVDPDDDHLTLGAFGAATIGSVVLDRDAGTIVYTPSEGEYGLAEVYYSILDGRGGVDWATLTIDVEAPLNVAPTAVIDNLTVTVGSPLVINVADLLLNDTDPEGDVLSFSALGDVYGGTAIYNAVDGTITYTADSLVGASFDYAISDGNSDIVWGRVYIDVIAEANIAPDAVNDTVNGERNTPLVITFDELLANDSDPDGDPLTVAYLGAGSSYGSAQIDLAAQTFTFTPETGYVGDAAQFSYGISDGRGGINFATVNVNIIDVPNRAPVTVVDYFTGEPGVPLVVTFAELLANDTDPDGDPLTIDVLGGSTNGTTVLDLVAQTITFTLDIGTIDGIFSYRVIDGRGGSDWMGAGVALEGANTPPTVLDDIATAVQDTDLVLTFTELLANDTDPDGDTLTIDQVSSASNGSVVIDSVAQTLTFTPNAGYVGDASFVYLGADGNGGSATATVLITVEARANTAPDAITDFVSGVENTPLVISFAEILANDSDPDGDALTLAYLGGDRSHGVAVIDLAAQAFTFTPDQDYVGDAAFFSYGVSDGQGGITFATVHINIVEQDNRAPVTTVDYFTAQPGTPLVVTFAELLANDTDPDGDPLTIDVLGGSTNGTAVLDLVAQTITFTLDVGAIDGTFSYRVIDGRGGEDWMGAGVALEGANTPPTPLDDNATVVEDNDLVLTFAELLANDTDLDGDTLSIDQVSAVSNGTVVIDSAAQTITFSPNTGYVGSASFLYRATDGNGGSATASVLITVEAGPNANPVTEADYLTGQPGVPLVITFAELLANDSDPDGDALSIDELGPDPYNGIATLDIAAQTITFTLDANASEGVFSYRVTDGNGGNEWSAAAITAVALPPNAAPVAVDDSATVVQDSDLVLTFAELLGNDSDPDGDSLTIDQVASPVNGGVTIDSVAQTITFTPTNGFVGNGSFTYQMSDGNGGSATASVIIDVTVRVNTAPVAVRDNVTTPVDTVVVINLSELLANDTDIDGDTLEIDYLGGSANGSSVFDGAAGTITFTPDAGFVGVAQFSYHLKDGQGGDHWGQVLVEVVDASNTAPVARGDVLTAVQDIVLVIDVAELLANDTDPDGDILSIDYLGADTNGDAVLDAAAGTITFTPDVGFSGEAKFSYRITDGRGGEYWAQAIVNVAPATVVTPITLDLDGDGLNFAPVVHFDIDNDGFLEATTWVGKGDGLLALDRNNDGIIGSGNEISFINDFAGATTDLEGLRGFDSNNDGVLNSDDTQFASFLVWEDINQDGISTPDELASLADRSIREINLTPTVSGVNPLAGVDLINTSTFSPEYGARRTLGDVGFQYSELAEDVSRNSGASGATGLEAALSNWASSVERNFDGAQVSESLFDVFGNLERSIAYGSVDDAGNGVIDSSATVTDFIYNAHGQLLDTISIAGTSTTFASFTYDDAGRLSTSTNANGSSTYSYDGVNHQVRMIDAAGLSTTQNFDTYGKLMSIEQYGEGETRTSQYFYDSAGRLRMSEDAEGGRQWTFYDTVGRVAHSVDATGAITGYEYTVDGLLDTETRYATQMSAAVMAGWATGSTDWEADLSFNVDRLSSDDITVDDDNDRITEYNYDGARRLEIIEQKSNRSFDIETEYEYDGASRTTLSGYEFRSLHDRFFYNDDGLKIVQVNPEGSLTEFIYDNVGRLTRSVRYDTDMRVRNDDTLDELMAQVVGVESLTTRFYYDGQGRQVGLVDENGFFSETVFDSTNRESETRQYHQHVNVSNTDTLSDIRSRAGAQYRRSIIEVDGFGRIVKVTGFDGSVSENEYDATTGRLTKVTVGVGSVDLNGNDDSRAVRTRYNAFGEVTGIVSGVGEDAIVNLNNAIDQYGTEYFYNAVGQRVRVEGAEGQRTLYYYDDANRLVSTINGEGDVSYTELNAFGELAASERFYRQVSSLSSRDGGNVSEIASWLSSNDNDDRNIESRVEYTQFGQLEREIDGEGGTSVYEYMHGIFLMGKATDTTSPNGASGAPSESVIYYEFNGVNQLTDTYFNAAGRGNRPKTEIEYDGFGRVIRTEDGKGNETFTEYRQTSTGLEIVVTDAKEQTITSHYDAFGRIDYMLDNELRLTDYQYDDATRTTTIVTPEWIRARTVLNVHGEVVESYDGRDNHSEFSYTKDGNLEIVTDRLNHDVATHYYDNSGRRILTRDAEYNLTHYGYDDANRVELILADTILNVNLYSGLGLIELAVNGDAHTHYEYDQNGRVTQESTELENQAWDTTQYAYTADGQLASVLRGSDAGSVQEYTEYQYDGLGQKIAQITDPNGESLIQSFAYDLNGNLTRVTAENGSNDIDAWSIYNELNQQTYAIDGDGGVVEYRYDSRGLLVETRAYVNTVSDAELATLQSADAPDSITLPAQSGQDRRSIKVFDDDSRLRFTFNLSQTNNWSASEYRYDANSNLIEQRRFDRYLANPNITDEDSAIAVLRSAGYLFESWGDSTDTDLNARRSLFAYDAENQLRFTVDTEHSVIENIYDDRGNIVITKEYLSEADFLPRSGTALTESNVINTNTASRDTRYAYDEQNHRTFVVDALNQVSGTTYNSFGQIIATTRYGVPLTGVSVYSDANILAAMTAADASQNRSTQFAYDDAGRQTHSVDDAGFVTQTLYNDVGRVQHVIEYSQAYSGNIDDVDSTSGNYSNTLGALTSLSLQDRIVTYVYDSAGRQKYSIDSLGLVLQSDYDGVGNLIKETRYEQEVALGASDQLTEALVSNLLNANTSEDRVTEYVYDNLGRRLFSVSGGETLTKTLYTTFGEVGERTAYDIDNLSSFAVTEAGLTSAIGTRRLDDNSTRGESYIYDNAGRLTQTTDAHGNTESNVYDALGNRTSLTNKNGETIIYQYDDLGRVTNEISPQVDVILSDETTPTRRYLVSNTSYDVLGRVTSRSEGLARTSVNAYDTVRDERTTFYIYDSADRVKYTVDAMRSVVENDYNSFGEVTKTTRYADENVILPNQRTEANMAALVGTIADAGNDRVMEYVYNNLGQRVYTIESSQTLSKTEYNAFGEVETSLQYNVAAPASRTLAVLNTYTASYNLDDTTTRGESYTYNVIGQLTRTDDAMGNFETYGYDSFGNRESFINKEGNEWTFEFDSLNRLTREETPEITLMIDGQSTTGNYATANKFTYDAFGNVKTRTEGIIVISSTVDNSTEALTTAYEYDALNRQIQITDPGWYSDGEFIADGSSTPGAFQRTTFVGFDAVGNAVANFVLTSVAGGTNEYVASFKVYDELNRVIYEIDPLQYVTGYEYNASSEEVSLTRYATALRDSLFDASSLNTRISLANIESASGLSPHANDRQITAVYDKLGRKSSVVQQLGDQDNNPETRYEFNAFGEVKLQSVRVGLTPTATWNDTHHYYDTLGRATVVVDGLGYATLMAYDLLGNVTRTTEYANLTTSVPVGEGVLADDRNVINSNEDRILTFAYDALNRQIEVRRQNFIHHDWSGTAFVSTSYNRSSSDIAGRLISVTDFDKLGKVKSTTDANDNVTSYDVNALGNITQVIQPERLATVTENTSPELLAIDPFSESSQRLVAPVVKFTLDVHGNVVQEVADPDPLSVGVRGGELTTVRVYDFVGNEVSTIKAFQDSEEQSILNREYDSAGRVRAEKQMVSAEFIQDESAYVDSYVQAMTLDPDDKNVLSHTKLSDEHVPFTWVYNGTTYTYYYDETEITEVKFVTYIPSSINMEEGVPGYEYDPTPLLNNLFLTVTYGGKRSVSLYKDDVIRREYYYDTAGNQVKTLNTYTDAADNQRRSGVSVEINAFGEVEYKHHLSGVGYANYEEVGSFDTPVLLESYTYDNAGRMATKTAVDGVTHFEYYLDGIARRQEQRGSGNDPIRVTEWGRDINGRVEVEHLPSFEGMVRFSNDTPSTTIADDYRVHGDDSQRETIDPVIEREYDRWGNVTRLIDVMGHRTDYSFDHNNQMVTETTQATVVDLVNSTNDNVVKHSVAKSHRFYYDLMGRAVGERDYIDGVEERTRRREYNNIGQELRFIDATNKLTEYRYNAHGQQVAIKDGNGYVKIKEYDHNGKHTDQYILRQSNGDDYHSGVTPANPVIRIHLNEYMYDEAGRLFAEVAFPHDTSDLSNEGVYKKYVFDERGLITRTINEEDVTFDYEFNSQGLKTREINALGFVKETSYKTADYQSSLMDTFVHFSGDYADFNGRNTTYIYNDFAQLKEEIVDDAKSPSSITAISRKREYHDNGLLKRVFEEYTSELKITDVTEKVIIGGTTGYSSYWSNYPGNSQDYLYSSTIREEVIDYDARGQRVREHINHSSTHTTYGRIKSSWDDVVGMTKMTWEEDVQSASSSGARTVYSEYDSAGQLIRVEAPRLLDDSDNEIRSEVALDYLEYAYDIFGNRLYVGTSHVGKGLERIDDNIMEIPDTEGGSVIYDGPDIYNEQTLANWYAYDDEGRTSIKQGYLNTSTNTIGMSDSSDSSGFSYDGGGRLAITGSIGAQQGASRSVTWTLDYLMATDFVVHSDEFFRVEDMVKSDPGNAELSASYSGTEWSGVINYSPVHTLVRGLLEVTNVYRNSDNVLVADITISPYTPLTNTFHSYNDLNQRIELSKNLGFTNDAAGYSPGYMDGIWTAEFNDIGQELVKTTMLIPVAGEDTFTRSVSTYGRDGRLLTQRIIDQDNVEEQSADFTLPGSYDAAGNLIYYRAALGGGTLDYTNTYAIRGGEYRIQSKTVVANSVQYHTGSETTYVYDIWGNLMNLDVGGDNGRTASYSYDVNGRIISEGATSHYYQNGNYLGNIDDDAAGLMPVTYSKGAPTAGTYSVTGGDSLQLIANSVWGDASLWYLIADANGLSRGPSEAFTEEEAGRILRIPNNDTTLRSNATTFKPYNPGEIIGDTTPGLVFIPPPLSEERCQEVTELISIIVTIVVTLVVTVATKGNAALGAAAGAAAGNISGQHARIRFNGNKDLLALKDGKLVDFYKMWDHNSIGISFLAGYVGGAVGGKVGAAAGPAVGAAVGAGVGYGANYALNRVSGSKVSWNNRNFLATVAAAAISSKAGLSTANTKGFSWAALGTQFVKSYASSAVSYATKKSFGVEGVHWDNQQALVDAFGNALGSAAGAAITAGISNVKTENAERLARWTDLAKEVNTDFGLRPWSDRQSGAFGSRFTGRDSGGANLVAGTVVREAEEKRKVEGLARPTMDRALVDVSGAIAKQMGLVQQSAGRTIEGQLDYDLSREGSVTSVQSRSESAILKKDLGFFFDKLRGARADNDGLNLLDFAFDKSKVSRVKSAESNLNRLGHRLNALPDQILVEDFLAVKDRLLRFESGELDLAPEQSIQLRAQAKLLDIAFNSESFASPAFRSGFTSAETEYLRVQGVRQVNEISKGVFGVLSLPAILTEALGGTPDQVAGYYNTLGVVSDFVMKVKAVPSTISHGKLLPPLPTRELRLNGAAQSLGVSRVVDDLGISTVRSSTSGHIIYGERDALGRPTGVISTITPSILDSGSGASRRILPPGFIKNTSPSADNHTRGHLQGNQLGGSGSDPRNLVTQFKFSNSPAMSSFENTVADVVRAGETVRYRVVPVYDGANLIPSGITIKARGTSGFSLDVSVPNTRTWGDPALGTAN